MICVTVQAGDGAALADGANEAFASGADRVELRLDSCAQPVDLGELIGVRLAGRAADLIVTCRRPGDGGAWLGDEGTRIALLEAAIDAGAGWVDIEEDAAGRISRRGATRRIVSWHDFNDTPSDLERVWARLARADADVVKLVTAARSACDGLRLLALSAAHNAGDGPATIAFAMGRLGQPSRLLATRFGAPWTYACRAGRPPAAPGQLPIDILREVYRLHDVATRTAVFGLIGDPVDQSLGYLVHNAVYDSLGFDGLYVPFEVPADELDAFLRGAYALGVAGLSVTIPHKRNALAAALDVSEMVADCGAANTLLRGDGGWIADNTDAPAAIDALRAAVAAVHHGQTDMSDLRVLVLGAGGIARAVIRPLVDEGATVAVSARRPVQAQAIASECDIAEIAWELRHEWPCDVLIQCTPVGMWPHVDATPFDSAGLEAGTIVFDTVYRPRLTRLLREAATHGCVPLDGVELFARQAARQIASFVRHCEPLDRIERLVLDRLSEVV